jgi:hypothetical protein
MKKVSFVVTFLLCSFVGSTARASTEATFVIGSLLGDDFVELSYEDLSLKSSFGNAPLFGARFGHFGSILGYEGNIVTTKTDLALGDDVLSLNTRIVYLEGNLVVMIPLGPIQPFVTGGGGAHYFSLTDFDDARAVQFGWNFGAGIKVNVSRAAFRFDIRNHRTTFDPESLGLDPDIIDLLGLEMIRLNNVELSFGVAIRF